MLSMAEVISRRLSNESRSTDMIWPACPSVAPAIVRLRSSVGSTCCLTIALTSFSSGTSSENAMASSFFGRGITRPASPVAPPALLT